MKAQCNLMRFTQKESESKPCCSYSIFNLISIYIYFLPLFIEILIEVNLTQQSTLSNFFLQFVTPGLSQAGRPGGHVPPQFLEDHLTLSQPGGGTLSPPSTTCPPGFSDLATALLRLELVHNNKHSNTLVSSWFY